MNPNVVSEEYLNLQKGIMAVQKEVRQVVEQKINIAVDLDDYNRTIPVLPQLKTSPVPVPLYKEAVTKITSYLQEEHPAIAEDLNKMEQGLSDEELQSWIKEAITFNTFYFQDLSEKREVAPWLPHFVAEQALRPFMQVLSKAFQSHLDEWSVMGTCPCCGEPPRLAKIGNKGEKQMQCPRCESEWKEKRLACVHCGEDRHEHLFYVTLEEDEKVKIEVCKTCSNYLKLIDTKKTFIKKEAALLDLETIHLDFIAQEEGYGDESDGQPV
ncbi:formate dehydrogenase accessory protein FdhE [Bacillus shivajii]|uniref:formate dehydrogenase accessory protein FdhE n=1 Tax=Bacillus shivajii TaxID=1983719 RepID=UPI001CFA5EBB|nr:formate dehydrogenase accessory protein FdhE [Bacillus shivajii]UCZ52390.1 formate dehydrogenase accessory protein FdhE [Bacillus shivajii]